MPDFRHYVRKNRISYEAPCPVCEGICVWESALVSRAFQSEFTMTHGPGSFTSADGQLRFNINCECPDA